LANVRAHPLWDAYWESKSVDLEDIVTPAFIVASWSDHGLHSRGSLEAYRRIKSKHKYLLVHGRKKWSHYYTPGNVERLRQFFDHFLRGTDDNVLSWPPVSLEIRRSAYEWTQRDENEWPLARTRYVPLYLDARSNSLKPELVGQESVARYDSENKDDAAVFDYVFPEATELTGPMKLRLWVEAESATDMDLFVAIQKTDAFGRLVPFMFYACFDNGPVALGWLRVSHRALDEARSTPERPVHSHLREDMLTPGVPVPVDIEIWPSSTYFEAGERLRVVIKGSDVYAESPPHLPFARHTDLRNRGIHIIHTGGDFDSHLLIPVTPPAEE
jgi:putative CocE/NonD family hydrolase